MRRTTCGLTQDYQGTKRPAIAGEGFVDGQSSVISSHAIPGTIPDVKTGMPKRLKYHDDSSGSGCPDQLSPARLARRGLLVEVVEMPRPGSKIAPSTMAIMDRPGHKMVTEFRLGLEGRRQTRKMMSRYWENASPLSIDLVDCVTKTGMFTGKMCKIDWLRYPTARDVMAA
ncbi:hypothetical protein Cob_v005276 [Colletotrichum orbiculare MAFF 240422]|uniref:Uncharacterized protein n=1 Tax=Colletotrichum orbiculare (strain 104-T / ATCC 96160 / CBS 514.97 / LARS 414 / MAFF 240422) TaxID=1213857 RepID=A0A484FV52_COLOR|nr:hypothetical protein Cob_v005276 [Colletotrichum orbiculare MAFF 240422]